MNRPSPRPPVVRSRPSVPRAAIATAAVVVTGTVAPGAVADIVLGSVSFVAMLLTVRRAHQLKGSTGWRAIAFGALLIGLAPAFTELHRIALGSSSPATVGDGVLLTGYLVMLGGLLHVLTTRTIALQIRVMLDSGLVVLWLGYAVLLITAPPLSAAAQGLDLLMSLAFLPLTLALVYLLLQLVLGSSSRSTAVWVLAAGMAATVVSELAFLGHAATDSGQLRRLGVTAATVGLVALATAIRHPSAVRLEEPTAAQRDPMSLRRVVYYVGSFLALSLAWMGPTPAHLVVLLAAIAATTSANLLITIRERERLLMAERELRMSVAEIMRATTAAEILETGGLAIDRLLAHKADQFCEFVAPEVDVHPGDQHGPPGSTDGVGYVTVPRWDPVERSATMESDLREALDHARPVRHERPSDVPGVRYQTRLVVPLGLSSTQARALVVEAAPVLATGEIEQVEQVVATVERALQAHDLQEERHQRRADRRFRALVQDSGDVVTVIDPETLHVTMVSPSMQRILGYGEADFASGNPARHLHLDDRPAVEDLLANAVIRPQSAPIDIRVRHADGYYHWFSATVRDLTNDDEIRGIVLNLNDIHDRKMAELSLSFSEQRYRTMVLSSKDVFAILEPDLTISYISPNVEHLLQFRAPDLVASQISNLLTEESHEQLLQFIADARGDLQNDVIELELRTPGRRNRIGEVTLSSREGNGGVSGGYTVSIRDVTEQRRLERSLRDQALYDRLTGLANRSTLHFELQKRLQGLRPDEHVGIIHLDINDFKTVNESVGYEAGDDLLVEVATRLRSSLRSSDVLARMGGNEFVVAVVTESKDEVVASAGRLVKLFDEPFELAGRPQRLAVSVGLHATSDRRTVARSLLDASSLALGAARASTQEAIRVFEPSLRASATERFELGADLGSAIARDQLSVVYQPIVAIASRKVRGVEALMRWTHPQRGPISPGVFIPLAEKSGLVIELGRWVMAQACEQLRTWHETVPGAERLTMSVNVSALQLERPGEAQVLAETVVSTGVEPHRVTVELTESTLIEDAAWIRSQLEILRGLGMRVAVDDFGTGAAGLSHLRDVPFNVVKIDKSYVDALSRSEEATNLVRGVIALAHSLGAETVAEGIEHPGEFELLQSLGCELGQGFFLARPMAPDQLEAWFALGRNGVAPALIAEPGRD